MSSFRSNRAEPLYSLEEVALAVYPGNNGEAHEVKLESTRTVDVADTGRQVPVFEAKDVVVPDPAKMFILVFRCAGGRTAAVPVRY